VRDRGFSLLEVLVALTLIGICFSVVFAGMSGSIKNLERIEITGRQVELARLKLAELDLIPNIRSDDSATGISADGTRWTIQSYPFIAPIEEGPRRNAASVIRIEITLEWPGRNGMQKRIIQTYRFQPGNTAPIPSLEEQLRGLQ
jgi:prepilin-type N-terminal cleavage/methylation domain-containing protein